MHQRPHLHDLIGDPAVRRQRPPRLAGDEVAVDRFELVDPPGVLVMVALIRQLRDELQDDAELRRSTAVLLGNCLASCRGSYWTTTRDGEVRVAGWHPAELLDRLVAPDADTVMEELILWLT